MGDLSKNLSRHEMACSCGCQFDTVDVELVEVLQSMCDHFATNDDYQGVILMITGPNRCKTQNDHLRDTWYASEGLRGAKTAENSQHQYGRGTDFRLYWRTLEGFRGLQIPPGKVADYLEEQYPGSYGIGRYENRTHLDTRTNGPARWDNT